MIEVRVVKLSEKRLHEIANKVEMLEQITNLNVKTIEEILEALKAIHGVLLDAQTNRGV